MIKTTMRFACAIAAALLFTTAAHAGRSCEHKPLNLQTIEQGMALAPMRPGHGISFDWKGLAALAQ